MHIIMSRQFSLCPLQRRMSRHYLPALGARIRSLREDLSWSQAELASKAGVHPNLIGRLERGIYNPTVSKLLAIAGALDVPLRRLV